MHFSKNLPIMLYKCRYYLLHIQQSITGGTFILTYYTLVPTVRGFEVCLVRSLEKKLRSANCYQLVWFPDPSCVGWARERREGRVW